jgi:peptidoglycan/LPS O-acetylase OafA/YrhL
MTVLNSVGRWVRGSRFRLVFALVAAMLCGAGLVGSDGALARSVPVAAPYPFGLVEALASPVGIAEIVGSVLTTQLSASGVPAAGPASVGADVAYTGANDKQLGRLALLLLSLGFALAILAGRGRRRNNRQDSQQWKGN